MKICRPCVDLFAARDEVVIIGQRRSDERVDKAGVLLWGIIKCYIGRQRPWSRFVDEGNCHIKCYSNRNKLSIRLNLLFEFRAFGCRVFYSHNNLFFRMRIKTARLLFDLPYCWLVDEWLERHRISLTCALSAHLTIMLTNREMCLPYVSSVNYLCFLICDLTHFTKHIEFQLQHYDVRCRSPVDKQWLSNTLWEFENHHFANARTQKQVSLFCEYFYLNFAIRCLFASHKLCFSWTESHFAIIRIRLNLLFGFVFLVAVYFIPIIICFFACAKNQLVSISTRHIAGLWMSDWSDIDNFQLVRYLRSWLTCCPIGKCFCDM